MKKVILLFMVIMIMVTLGCEGNTTGQYRHKPGHHNDKIEKPVN